LPPVQICANLGSIKLIANERKMQIEQVLQVARETVENVTYCFAITLAGNGEANARIIQPRRLQEDWTADFTTSRRCRKFREIEQTRKVTLAYQHDPEKAYVCLSGPVSIIDDVELKRSRWSAEADRWYPGGPDDPNVVIIRLTTSRIELWNAVQSIMPEPKGLSAAVLVRDRTGWRYLKT
jgi:general stress protein 26